MLKKKIAVRECPVGHILAKPVLNNYGALVVVESTCMNEYIKSRLQDMHIEHVWVYEPCNDPPTNAESGCCEEFKSKYTSNVIAVKEALLELAAGNNLNTDKIGKICDSLYSEIRNTDFIIKCIGEIKNTDEYTYTHCINVALYSMLTAKWLRLSPCEIKNVVYAGLLHDIGKVKIPPHILNKPSKLSPEEFEEMKKHTIYGYDIVKSIGNITEDIRQAVLMHHEREDETGYPTGAKGDLINVYSRIVAVSDVYDAMTSERVYKKRATPFEAFHMFNSSGLSSFDNKVSMTLMKNLSANYTGTKVILNSGETGEIAYIPPHNLTKPVISLKSKYVDTAKDNFIKIERVVK